MCIGGKPSAPAPMPPIQPVKDEPEPILKLRKDDGTEEEVTRAEDVKQDTGATSTSVGKPDDMGALAIPKPKKTKSAASVGL